MYTLSPGAESKSLVDLHFLCSFPIEPVSLRGAREVEWRRGGGTGVAAWGRDRSRDRDREGKERVERQE